MKTPRSNKDGLFGLVPAYRFATFRTLFALVNIFTFIPRLNQVIYEYIQSSFHLPMQPWIPIPALPAQMAPIFIPLQYLASGLLFLGIIPRISAGFLSMSGLYIFLLDAKHYSHTAQFHLLLLAILAVSKNKLSLIDLFQEKKRKSSYEEAWPEYLVRFQLSIVFFYTALDKIFSPFWGYAGTFFIYELGDRYLTSQSLSPLPWLQTFVRSIILTAPGIASMCTIALEFFLAAAFLFKPFWKWAIIAGLFFTVMIKLLMNPEVFAWDLMATLVLLLPTSGKSDQTAVLPSKAR